MNLRRSQDRSRGFDVFFIFVALIGMAAIWFGFLYGGAWNLLAAAAFLGEILLAFGIWREPQRLVVRWVREALGVEPKVWIKTVFLSDLHAGGFKSRVWYERVAREVAALRPDVIILGGDYVVDRAEPIVDLAPLGMLTARLGRFFVLGNHDYVDQPQEIRRVIASWGYEDMTNRSVVIHADGRSFELQGIDDCWYGAPQKFQRISRLIPHLLVSHEPDTLLDLNEGDTDIVLIGHTHGGQVRLPILGALLPIPAHLGRLVDRGRKIIHGIRCLITSGLGESDIRMRLFDPPEILLVEIGI